MSDLKKKKCGELLLTFYGGGSFCIDFDCGSMWGDEFRIGKGFTVGLKVYRFGHYIGSLFIGCKGVDVSELEAFINEQ